MRLYKVMVREKDSHAVWTELNLLAEDLGEVIALAKKRLDSEYAHPENFEVTDATIIAFIDTVEGSR